MIGISVTKEFILAESGNELVPQQIGYGESGNKKVMEGTEEIH